MSLIVPASAQRQHLGPLAPDVGALVVDRVDVPLGQHVKLVCAANAIIDSMPDVSRYEPRLNLLRDPVRILVQAVRHNVLALLALVDDRDLALEADLSLSVVLK